MSASLKNKLLHIHMTARTLSIAFLAVLLKGCALFDMHHMILRSEQEMSDRFDVSVRLLSISKLFSTEVDDESFRRVEEILYTSGIPNIETCKINKSSFQHIYRSSSVQYEVNCSEKIIFQNNGYGAFVLYAGRRF